MLMEAAEEYRAHQQNLLDDLLAFSEQKCDFIDGAMASVS
jgi:hypothetical protein